VETKLVYRRTSYNLPPVGRFRVIKPEVFRNTSNGDCNKDCAAHQRFEVGAL